MNNKVTTKQSVVVRPKKTLKSLDPSRSPLLKEKVSNTAERTRNIKPISSAPTLLLQNAERTVRPDVHFKCYSSRSHSKLKDLKDEIDAYREKERLFNFRNKLYKSCGVVLDDVGEVAADKAVQAELQDIDAVSTNLRRNEWLKEIGRPDLLNKTDIKHNSYKVCSIHFESSVMSEVLVRKLLPGAVPNKFLPKQPQPSTSKCENESRYSDVSTQTKYSCVNILSAVKIKNASMTDDDTQTARPEKEQETQTTQTLSSATPIKRKLHNKLQASEKMKIRLEYELDKRKKK